MKLIVTILAMVVCYMKVAHGGLVCRVNDKIFPPDTGLSFQADYCNVCRCTSSAELYCTRVKCKLSFDKCQIKGQFKTIHEYKEGAQIKSEDCETCDCRNGNVVCQGCTS